MRLGTLDGLMPAVNFASRANAPPGTVWGPRLIPDCQLFYVVSGGAELAIGGRRYAIRPGECVYYGPEQATRLATVEATDFFSVHFDWTSASAAPVHPGHRIADAGAEALRGDVPPTLLEVASHGEIAVPTKLNVSGLEPILTRMIREYELEQPGFALSLRALMMQAIAAIVRQLLDHGGGRGQPGRIDAALGAMREQPERSWTVAELARLCGYHPIHFAKLFKEEIGLTPKAYLIAEKVKRAKRALLQGEKAEAIAAKLGFASVHYFSHQFKRVTGLTPTEFRLQGRLEER